MIDSWLFMMNIMIIRLEIQWNKNSERVGEIGRNGVYIFEKNRSFLRMRVLNLSLHGFLVFQQSNFKRILCVFKHFKSEKHIFINQFNQWEGLCGIFISLSKHHSKYHSHQNTSWFSQSHLVLSLNHFQRFTLSHFTHSSNTHSYNNTKGELIRKHKSSYSSSMWSEVCVFTQVFDSNSSNNQNTSINHCSPIITKMWIFDFGSVWRGFGGLTCIWCWVSVHWGLIWRVIIAMWLWDIDDKWEWHLNENADLKRRNTKMGKQITNRSVKTEPVVDDKSEIKHSLAGLYSRVMEAPLL